MSQPNIPRSNIPEPKVLEDDDMLPEYDFSNAVRGKHFASYRGGTNVIFLDPDVALAFKDSEHVNRVLRMILSIANEGTSGKGPEVR